MEQALRRRFEVGGHKAYWLARLGAQYDVHLVSNFGQRGLERGLLERLGFTPVGVEDHEGHLRKVAQGAGGTARIGVIPHAGHTLPTIKQRQEAISA